MTMVPETQNTVWSLINDLETKKGISEIVINDPKTVFVERSGHFIQLNVNLNKNDIYLFIEDIANFNKKKCDADHPILDGNLPDGSRINIISEPFSQNCPAITIRKYLKSVKSFDQNPTAFGLNDSWIEFFKALVGARMNLMISGGTGVGKTTFLNLLLAELSPQERVVTIEDTIELSINFPNVVRLEAGSNMTHTQAVLTTRDLVKNTLRMRPDRVIIGEIRGEELFDLLQAMNTGHDGSMSSVHANSPAECLSRLETLFLLAGYDVPHHVVRKQMTSALDFIIQLGRNREGKRIIKQISEVTGMEGDSILLQTIAEIDEDEVLRAGKAAPKRMAKLNHMGGLPLNFFNS
jgi:pilus assembly protein CpaF